MKNDYVGGKARAARIGIVSVVVMAAVVILAPNALGANHSVNTTGSTYISSGGTCIASVTAPSSGDLDVNNGDSVTIYYNYTYTDGRTSASTLARHDFTQLVEYDDAGTGESHWYNTTIDMESGVGGIQMTVSNVRTGTSIWVLWYANITSDGICSDYAWDEAYISLV